MKNKYLIIIIGFLFLLAGVILYLQRGRQEEILPSVEGVISRDEAVSIFTQTVTLLTKVYEVPSEVFETRVETVDEKEMVQLINYEEVMPTIFTEKGKSQLEKTSFGKEKFLIRNDDGVFILKELPLDNRYKSSNVNIEEVKLSKKEISCNVTFSDYTVDEEGTITYYVITKYLRMLKVEDKWLVDDFAYYNE